MWIQIKKPVFYGDGRHKLSSIALFKDNQTAIIVSETGRCTKLNWKKKCSCMLCTKIKCCFEKIEDYGRIWKEGHRYHQKTILTNNEEDLLIGSEKSINIFNFETRQVTKELNFSNDIRCFEAIGDEKKAVVVERNGRVTILDNNLEEISKKFYIDFPGKEI